MERLEDLLGQRFALGGVLGPVGRSQLLVAPPSDLNLVVGVALAQALIEAFALAHGEVLLAAVEDVADPVERVLSVPAPAQGGLLDSAADLVQRLAAKFDDVKCVESRGAVSRRRGNEELLEGFAWGEVAQARSGAFVELFGDGGEVGLVVGDVGALGQVLTDQTDGALVGSALPR